MKKIKFILAIACFIGASVSAFAQAVPCNEECRRVDYECHEKINELITAQNWTGLGRMVTEFAAGACIGTAETGIGLTACGAWALGNIIGNGGDQLRNKLTEEAWRIRCHTEAAHMHPNPATCANSLTGCRN